jgi:hypothetical protein
VAAPKLDPGQSAAEAIRLYDENGDGEIGGEELTKCPSLMDKKTNEALAQIDKDGNGAVSEEEIADRIRFFTETKLGSTSLACQFRWRGQPLQGATVTFVPEPFMKDFIQPASGSTGINGMASLSRGEGIDNSGITVGFYKIEVSKQDASGKELLPAKYNTETTLGQEVTLGSQEVAMGLFYDLR